MTEVLLSCFFITPMSEKNSDIDKRSKSLIKKFNSLFSSNDKFIKVQRTDQYHQVGIMTENIHQQIKGADLIIADLTGINPNVTYELGYANAFNKPIIQICSSANFHLPSDNRHIYTLDYDLDNEGAFFQFEQSILETVNSINFDTDYIALTPTLGFQRITTDDQ